MTAENNQKDQPRADKKVDTDAMFYELGKTLNRIVWVTQLAVLYFKYLKRLIDLLTNLMIASWFGLILMGIWSDNSMYFKIAFTIITAGGILVFLFKGVFEFTKKPAEKKPTQPPMSEDAMRMMVLAGITDRLKNDENYRNEVGKKFYQDLMKDKPNSAEGSEESKS